MIVSIAFERSATRNPAYKTITCNGGKTISTEFRPETLRQKGSTTIKTSRTILTIPGNHPFKTGTPINMELNKTNNQAFIISGTNRHYIISGNANDYMFLLKSQE
jgi:hypothetical protein